MGALSNIFFLSAIDSATRGKQKIKENTINFIMIRLSRPEMAYLI
jgi:hypothetical protein